MSTTSGLLELHGRDHELALLCRAVDDLPHRGGAFIVHGEAGIGKTVLLDEVRRQAGRSGVRVLQGAGVVAETDLPFAGLHRLLRPVLGKADELPDIQRQALRSVFGDGDDRPDQFLVALAVLGLLSAAASTTPLLVVVDDYHWFDQPSRDAIAFVARRLESDPVLILIGLRDGYQEVTELGLPSVELQPLPDDVAARLLDQSAPDLSERLRVRVLQEARGNPLALVELPAAGSASVLETGGTAPLTLRLESAFAARAGELPPETATILLLASADEAASVGELFAAAEHLLGHRPESAVFQPAIGAHLVTITNRRVRFRHPLVRSAIYQTADLKKRVAAHGALATVLDRQADRQAWHRAAATIGTDDAVADDLEALAERFRRRGTVLQSALAFARSAQLTTSEDSRARRLLQAAELAFQVGHADLVRAYVDEARQLNLNWRNRARVEWLSEIFHDGTPGDSVRVMALADLAAQARDDDHELALTLLHAAALRSWWGDPGTEARARVVEIADLVGQQVDDARLIPIVAMAEPLRRSGWVMDRVTDTTIDPQADAERSLMLGMAAHAVGDFDRSMRILQPTIDTLRAHGRLGLLTHAVGMFASAAVHICDWPLAASAAGEFEQLARETDQPVWRAGAAVALCAVAGVAGDEERAVSYAAEAERLLAGAGAEDILCVLQNSRGVAALAAGRHEDAYLHLIRAFDPRDPAFHHRERFVAIAHLADAGVAIGRHAEVRQVLEELIRDGDLDRERAVLRGLHYARAVLADDDEAEDAFTDAFGRIPPQAGFVYARLNLAFGAWLRRRRRSIESREPLRIAREAFDRFDAPYWSELARQELRASGEASHRRRVNAWDALSPQELQIAQLAAAGLSNREIGQRLYLSHRTIASHLYRIFPKLGVSSRAQLSAVLPSDEPAPEPVRGGS